MFDIAALGEILIDFTMQGFNTQRQRIFAQNPGGAPANVAAAVAKLGGKAAFLGKAGDDMQVFRSARIISRLLPLLM